MALISIIVPIYQVEENQLRRCLDSLIGQTMQDIEIILVDDGSPDPCGAVCDEYGEKDVRVHVIHQENGGVSAARNRGMEEASGQWIAFVDGDDWVEESMCQTMWDHTEKVNADVLVFASYIHIGEEAYVNSFFKDQFRVFAGESKDEAILQCIYPSQQSYRPPFQTASVSWAKLYRAEFLKQFDLKFLLGLSRGQDTLFSIRSFEAAGTILYVDEPVYHHTQHEAKDQQFIDRIFRTYNVMLEEIWKYIEEFQKSQSFYDAYYARVNGCLLSEVNIDYFHPDNPKRFRVRRNALKRLVRKQPYREALGHVDKNFFTYKSRLGLRLLRRRMIRIYYLIWRMRRSN
jgi:glycosyltransferase involved in cell wall biosynthesis